MVNKRIICPNCRLDFIPINSTDVFCCDDCETEYCKKNKLIYEGKKEEYTNELENHIQRYKLKIGDICCFKEEFQNYNQKNDIIRYKIQRMWHDLPEKDHHVELVKIKDSILNHAVLTCFTDPMLYQFADEIFKAIDKILNKKIPNWTYDEIENEVIITQEKFLRPAGKTHLKIFMKYQNKS